MKAVLYDAFRSPPRIENVPDPTPPPDGVVVKVMATGLCRSDWHGWMGHDPDIVPPHVPGHELAGTVELIGPDVRRWRKGDRVTVPFVLACGRCPQCASGNQQVCDFQTQPGFNFWGSFAEYVAIDRADINLVRLPDSMSYTTAASLGCRFVTSFRAVVDQGKLSAGQWLAVHGCGGVGLSAIMIAHALGVHVIAIDVTEEKLDFARSLGASATINAQKVNDVPAAVRDLTNGGAHVSIDALGSAVTSYNSISSLRRRGKHIQVGLMVGDASNAAVPMSKLVFNELEIIGSHGMQAWRYEALMNMIAAGQLAPDRLVGRTINLEQSIGALVAMDKSQDVGITVITEF